MKASTELYFMITTMDGIPYLNAEGQIHTYRTTQSMRQAAKHLTFTTGQRHHTR